MSWQIQISRAKPNPQGKDRHRYGSPDAEQLLAEWVDIKNVGDTGVNLSTLNLAHLEFDEQCRPKAQPKIYWTGPSAGILHPGQVIRVHTGKSSASIYMRVEDRNGVDHHGYAESGNYILNNRCGDTLSVWWKSNDNAWNKDDEASYDPNPPEGAVLVRNGRKLVVATFLTAAYR